MKAIAKYLAKKYAFAAVKDAVSAHGGAVSAWSVRVGGWLAVAQRVVAFLSRLSDRLADGELTDAEADATLEEAQGLVREAADA